MVQLSETPLVSDQGELLFARYSTEPRMLEDVLEALAAAPFPINPHIHHARTTVVEFPLYSSQLDRLERTLRSHAIPLDGLTAKPMLEELRRA